MGQMQFSNTVIHTMVAVVQPQISGLFLEEDSHTGTLMAADLFDHPASCVVISSRSMPCRLSDSIHFFPI